ncbi:MAG: DUF4476 domain-containing protein [Flavobacterium sp.]
MKTLLLSTITLLFATLGHAQLNPVGHLTIFSEDGQKFYLELNGERYNTEPQTNVRIEELPNPYYSCKVVFADGSIPTLSKNTLDIADMDGIMQDVTYRIKNSNGKRSLKYYSSVPVEGMMPRPKNVPVYRYGTPNDMIVRADGVVITETTTVHHSTGMGETVGVGMNVGGVNMGVSINVPGETSMSTTTTTTTTSSGTRYNNEERYVEERPRGCRNAMSPRDYEEAKATIKSIAFDDTKASTAMQIISANCLNTTQIIGLLDLFSFEDTKLELAKTAYGYCVDHNNYYKVVTAFKFDSSKEELNKYMAQNRR